MTNAATTHAMGASSGSASDAALRWIGDLDHPFYEDERNRFIWYEAQAIGFQFMGLASYFAAAISLLIGGSGAIPYAAAMMAPFIVSAVVLKAYVVRRGADYWPQSMDFRRSRGMAVLAIMALLFIGFGRAFIETDGGISGIAGMLTGGVSAGVAIALLSNRKKKKDAADQLSED